MTRHAGPANPPNTHSYKPVADCSPGPNLRRLLVGLDVERESVWLAAEGRYLVHGRYRRLLCHHRPFRGIRTDSQIVENNLPPCAPMSLKDLLTFNLFLQFTDGLISYQAFALGAAEANPVVAAAIVNWGMGWGLLYNKALACLLLVLIFALRHNRRLLATRGLTVTASVYVCAITLSLATPAITLLTLRLRRL
jgi:Domain of unknown function (DUF5658)